MKKKSLPQPLQLVFVWHMHQPYYIDDRKKECAMPWVRLHAIKDYFEMAHLLEFFPKIKAVFNYVPSLLVQLEKVASGEVDDYFLILTKKDPKELSSEEIEFILKNFFSCNHDHMIRPYPRFKELLEKKEKGKPFSHHDLMDLQVWYNLAWFGHLAKTRNPIVRSLIKKGRRFNKIDKALLIAQQYIIIKTVIPLLKKLARRGQIELSVSPFFHPILPLLIDRDATKEGLPGGPLPETPFNEIDEARWQLREAREYFNRLFGFYPAGIWPSEGSVSEAALAEIQAAGFTWAATDQGILAHSLAKVGRPLDWPLASWELYAPWQLKKQGPALFFRDLSFSNDISFNFSSWKGATAAHEIIKHLETIHEQIPADREAPLVVSIIMDGENAWEFYEKNAIDFFRALYRGLSNSNRIATTTYSQYLEKYPVTNQLEKLWSGSWIYSNFSTWIGCKEKNMAWELLARTKNALKNFEALAKTGKAGKTAGQVINLAYWELRIAEGSDWFWWLGYDHNSEYDRDYEESFRSHLKNVYTLIGHKLPDELFKTINDYSSYMTDSSAKTVIAG